MMTAAGIVFERHGGTTTVIAGASHLTQTAERSMHRRPSVLHALSKGIFELAHSGKQQSQDDQAHPEQAHRE